MRRRAAPDWLTRQDYAHRGLHSAGVAENSLSAVKAAVAAGMGIECDIQLSRDNVPLVFHDWDLDRLTSNQGRVADHEAGELCRMALNGGDDSIWPLSEMLQVVAGKVPILIEIKSMPRFDIASACAATRAAIEGYIGPLAVMSFDPRMGEWFASNAPQTTRGLVCTDTLDHGFLNAWRSPGALEQASPDFLAFDVRDLPNATAELWRDAERPLLTWTVRSADLRKIADAHTDAAIAEGGGLA